MAIHPHDLEYAEYLQPTTGDGRALHLIRARGRAACLEVPSGWHSVWLPISGGMRVKSQATVWNLAPRDLLVWHEGGLHNCAQQPSWFVALCGPPEAWRPYLPLASGTAAARTGILPAHGRCPIEVRRLLVRLARLADRVGTTAGLVENLVAACCSAIYESQGEIHAYLARCGGRTAEQRRHTLLRLLRVRHLIANCSDRRIDVRHLSRIANYSQWHLTRAYREVFGETPSEHATRVRLSRAVQMVRHSDLTVREITEALGFESQSTFCRQFKRAYGMTTTQARLFARKGFTRLTTAGQREISPIVGIRPHATNVFEQR